MGRPGWGMCGWLFWGPILYGLMAGALEMPRAAAVVPKTDRSMPPLDPSVRAQAHFATGLLLVLNNETDAAFEHLRLAADADPAFEPLVLEVARQYLARNQADAAHELLTRSASRPEASGQVFLLLGAAHVQRDRVQEAISAFREAIRRKPDLLEAHRRLIALLLDQGRIPEARAALADARQPHRTDPEHLVELAGMYAGFAAVLETDPADTRKHAVALLDQASQGPSESPLLLQNMADVYARVGADDPAVAIYRRLQRDFPRWPGLEERLAGIYLRRGEVSEAQAQLEALARKNPTHPEAHFLLGALAMAVRDLPRAVDHFRRSLVVNPGLEAAYFELAAAQLSLGQPRDALATIERARDKFPRTFALEYYSALAWRELEDYDQALAHFTAAELEARAGDTNQLGALFYFQVGATCERRGDLAAAEIHFRRCLERAPDFAEALNYLGYMWAEKGIRLDESRELIERAVRLEPENTAFLDSLGWVLHQQGHHAQALPYLLAAVDRNPAPDPVLLDHLGDVLAALGRRGDARNAWRRALELEPDPRIERKLESADP